jgi:hypothetical protein
MMVVVVVVLVALVDQMMVIVDVRELVEVQVDTVHLLLANRLAEQDH